MRTVAHPRLVEIATIERTSVAPMDIDDGTVYVGLENITASGEIVGARAIGAGDVASTKFRFTPEHVLYGKLRPNLRKVACPDFAGIASTDILPIRPGERTDRRYLFHFLRSGSVVAWAARRCGGANLPRLSPTLLSQLRVPLPALDEQRRIVSILDRISRTRHRARERQLALSRFLSATFVELFGDPIQNPHSFPLEPMRRMIDCFEAGSSVGGEDRDRLADEWAVLKISAVTSGEYLPAECKVAQPPERGALVVPRRGDLLFSRANTRELVAATCLVDNDDPRLFLPDKLWRVVPVEGRSRVEYLRFLFAHPAFRATVAKRASGTSGSMLNVSQEKVMALRAPRPPLNLQDRFADIVWRALELRRKFRSADAEIEGLAESLSDRAFRGEL